MQSRSHAFRGAQRFRASTLRRRRGIAAIALKRAGGNEELNLALRSDAPGGIRQAQRQLY